MKFTTGNQLTTAREISNEKAAARKEFLSGRTPVQALYDLILSGGYTFKVKLGDNGNLKALFFSKDNMLAFSCMYKYVFMMDCTYKTNRLGMPLLNIVGITSTFKTFNAGFAFLSAEKEEDYQWALEAFGSIVEPKLLITDRELALMNAINSVFPNCIHLLCIWHINTNIFTNTMTDKWDSEERFKNFMSDWNSLLYSGKQIDFEHNWQVFQDKYNSIAKHSLDYIARIWIPLKEKFVSCWADKHLHLGSITTSRIEGNHSVLKKYLKHINNDLLMSIQKIDAMLDNQVTEINALIGKETMQITHRHSNPMIAALTRKMSQHALDLFMVEFKAAKNVENSICECNFSTKYGIPCRHDTIYNKRQISGRNIPKHRFSRALDASA